ncbi:MAG: dTDP-glucose 4,6-dehydratase [Deltaproteobacteria bacterium]|nr:dTDP-glucose 4,6-dehydratase [Deltaproteobacteria bacterium]MBW2362630.1 dTDP-glucose 4,6-dehydratase [Deltaproteobacteria bacterium]
MPTWLVTGGAGFIGANFVRHALAHSDARIVVVDKLTYAGHMESLDEVADELRFSFVRADIAEADAMAQIFREHSPDAVLNFAAETHVDRSIDGPAAFIETNLIGTFVLLEAARAHVAELPESERARFRFLQVSTDEVYGTLGPSGAFSETTPYEPNSPYSASKAGADHLVRAYHGTYDLRTLITNCSNNYGPYQFPEKLIPLMVLNAIEGKSLPIYGDGGHVRDWLYVDDHCSGIRLALEHGRPGEKYNIGGQNERTNLELVDTLCARLEEALPAAQNPALQAAGIADYASLKTFVEDRPGHDRRYAIDASKIRDEIGWRPSHDVESGLAATVRWYLEHRDWCEAVQSRGYARERLGLEASSG